VQVVAASCLPVGCLGESASEARNKIYKNDRRSHARQNSRLNTMTDVFCKPLDSLDPMVSSIQIKERVHQNKKRNSYPLEVIDLLTPPNVDFLNSYSTTDNDDEDDLDTFECIDAYSLNIL